ncbi:MAG: hypothetical protein J5740_01025 [Bacteroidales bacterium]|nr:hypothetical protein [Bacteroidales bacterium]
MPKFGLIGNPAAGSKSPALFAAAYGGRYPYEIIEEEDFDKAFKRFISEDFKAVNVTAPHKCAAADCADWRSPDVDRIGAANILVKTPAGSVEAFNSDVLAVRKLIDGLDIRSAIVIGLGGAGRAAFDACLSAGLKTSFRHHDFAFRYNPVAADLIVYALPKAVSGIENIKCRYLLEANYLTPCCSDLPGVDHYISGEQWLKAQAILGYGLMTGEAPDTEAIASAL